MAAWLTPVTPATMDMEQKDQTGVQCHLQIHMGSRIGHTKPCPQKTVMQEKSRGLGHAALQILLLGIQTCPRIHSKSSGKETSIYEAELSPASLGRVSGIVFGRLRWPVLARCPLLFPFSGAVGVSWFCWRPAPSDC